MQYRREIDGLRALAVLPVILFHAGFRPFEGGFVGVDVFFVISGYLITTIIVDDHEAGRFSILKFYERRARRILPALFIVMACCVPFAWLWMTRVQAGDFAESIVATSLFSSNFLFWLESGYFSAAADEKPLLHTWSLAVEEQFYLLFPLILLLTWKSKKPWLTASLALVAIISIIVAELGWRYFPVASFYLIFSRAWELMIGAFVALYLIKYPVQKTLANPAAALGLAMLVFSVFAFDQTTPFPGFLALIPTIGTALIILFARPGNLVGDLLSLPVFVTIGLFSYSAYLWHQPLFAFARIRSLNEPEMLTYIVLGLLSLALGWFSWRYIEQPFRQKGRFSRRRIFRFSAAVSLLAIGVGSTVIAMPQILDLRLTGLPQSSLAALQVGNYKQQYATCQWRETAFEEFYTCALDNLEEPGSTVLLYGDSHADAIFPALSAAYAGKNVRVLRLRLETKKCEYLIGSYRWNRHQIDDAHCFGLARQIGEIANQMNAQAVYILLRYTFRLYPTDKLVTALDFDNGEGGFVAEKPRKYYVSKGRQQSTAVDDKYKATLRFFEETAGSFNGGTLLIGPVPEAGWSLELLNERMLLQQGRVQESVSTDFSLFKSRNKLILEILADADKNPKISVFYPHELFCDAQLAGRCVVQTRGIPQYFDDDHPNDIGADKLVQALIDRFEAPKLNLIQVRE